MAESHESPDPNPLFAGRLRLNDESKLVSHGATTAFDEKTNQHVVVALAAKTLGNLPTQLGSASQAHLNPVIDVIEREKDWLVISRDLKATRLSQQIADEGARHAVDAVRTVLRVADAISHLHDLGLTHGRVHPDNVLVGLPEAAEPSLLFGTVCPPAYVRPERQSAEEPPDPRDDAWAATALLYFMLTGNEPPRAGLSTTADLDTAFIDDTLLRDVLFHGLAQNPAQRAKDLFALKRELARWFIAHAADEPMPPSLTHSHKPPPLPPSLAPRPRTSVRTRGPVGAEPIAGELRSQPSLRSTGSTAKPTKPVWLRSVSLAVMAAVLGIGVAWGISILRKGELTVVLKDRVTPGAPSAEPSASGPIDLAEVPVTGKEQQTGDATASCVRGYLRDGTLVKVPQLDSICKDAELPRGLGTLRLAFASSTGQAPASAARFDTLGWYSLPTLIGLRQACCGDNPTPMKLPDLGDACSDFGPALDTLARAVSSSQALEAAIRRFDDAAKCAAKSGRATGISASPPSPVSERAFRELFAAIAPAADPSTSAAGSASPRASATVPTGTAP